MQGKWYNYFLKFLRYYYNFKNIIKLFILFFFLLKLISIFLDLYYGYFPDIFNNQVFFLFLGKVIMFSVVKFLYFYRSLWVILWFFYFFFWNFFRESVIDNIEIERRLEKKELLKKTIVLKKAKKWDVNFKLVKKDKKKKIQQCKKKLMN